MCKKSEKVTEIKNSSDNNKEKESVDDKKTSS